MGYISPCEEADVDNVDIEKLEGDETGKDDRGR